MDKAKSILSSALSLGVEPAQELSKLLNDLNLISNTDIIKKMSATPEDKENVYPLQVKSKRPGGLRPLSSKSDSKHLALRLKSKDPLDIDSSKIDSDAQPSSPNMSEDQASSQETPFRTKLLNQQIAKFSNKNDHGHNVPVSIHSDPGSSDTSPNQPSVVPRRRHAARLNRFLPVSSNLGELISCFEVSPR
jgi:hypothetical protein